MKMIKDTEKTTKANNSRFYYYAARYLREEFAEKTEKLNDEELKNLIDDGLRAAHANHFATQADAMAFIDIDMRLENVLSDNTPPAWAQKILTDASLTNEQKLNCLRDAYCTFEWLEQAHDTTK